MNKTLASDVGLRGRVMQCIEQTIYSAGDADERALTTTSVYSLDGHLLQRRTEQSQGRDYVTTFTYAAGNLVKTSSGVEGSEQYDTAYAYDDKGRLASIMPSTGDLVARYEYDEQGRKRRIENISVFDARSDTAMASTPWEGSDLHFARASGGTITTIYDERDRPIEAKVRDAAGQLTVRIVREYDEQGRVLGDQLFPEEMESSIPGEMSAQLNDAQKKAVAKFLERTFGRDKSVYKYDSQGHVIEKRITSGLLGNEVTKLQYDDHGNLTDEETTRTPTPEMSTEFGMDDAGNMVAVSKSKAPVGSSQTALHYTYEYDAQGNWTQKTMSARSEPGGEFKVMMRIHRTLIYY